MAQFTAIPSSPPTTECLTGLPLLLLRLGSLNPHAENGREKTFVGSAKNRSRDFEGLWTEPPFQPAVT